MVIARLDLEGNIDQRLVNRLSPALEYARNKRKVSAVILHMNSPGGGATASEVLVAKIKELSKRKPVYSVISGLGASGAYWVASVTDKIYAMRTSIVGSIGIISIVPSFADLLDKLGVKVDIAKIGEYKSLMSPFEKRDEGDKEHLIAILGDLFESFKSDVIEKRKLKEEVLPAVINGDIFSSKRAVDLGLVDTIGGVEDAVADLRERFKIGGRMRNITPRAPFLSRVVGMSVESALNRGVDLLFQYR